MNRKRFNVALDKTILSCYGDTCNAVSYYSSAKKIVAALDGAYHGERVHVSTSFDVVDG